MWFIVLRSRGMTLSQTMHTILFWLRNPNVVFLTSIWWIILSCLSVYDNKYGGVFEDYILRKLFPHSFAGDAVYWLKHLPPRSLTTWHNPKKVFLNKFFKYDATTQESKLESMMRQILEGQQKVTVDFKKQLDSVYIELKDKFEALNSHVIELDIQFTDF